MKRNGDYILTYTGIEFYPLDARIEEVSIHDIAHSLSNLCRFTGHTREFYSVAEHCVHVSNLVMREHALWGLIHDAPEAYMNDIARPIKRMDAFSFYAEAENELLQTILNAFNMSTYMPIDVLHADDLMLAIEARDLMRDCHGWRDLPPIPECCTLNVRNPMSPREAKSAFMSRFTELSLNSD